MRHCTFVNGYIGIQFNPDNGGGCPNIADIYGTQLYEGFEIDCIADVSQATTGVAVPICSMWLPERLSWP